MERLIEFLKDAWVWVVSVALGTWVFLNSQLDEFTRNEKIVFFVISIVVFPLFANRVYTYLMTSNDELPRSFRPIRFGCATFLLGLILWNNIPLEGVSGWVKFLLGAILFAAFPLMVQVFFESSNKKNE